MAEPITMQGLIDANVDADTLGEFANEDKIVTSRLGAEYPSAPMASRLLVENGLLGATPFSTYAAMTASTLANGDYAIVTDDIDLDKNGYWQKQSGAWKLLKWNPIEQAKEYVNSNPLFKPVRLSDFDDLDVLFTAGIYHVPTNETASILGLPGSRLGQIYVSGNTRTAGDGYVFQTYINADGSVFQRTYTGTNWLDWKGNDSNLVITKGGQPYKIVANIEDIGGHLDNAFADGLYFISTSGTATEANGFPIVGSGGFLNVITNGSGYTHQRWETSNGTAHRYGNKVNGVAVWTAWTGFINNGSNIIDLVNNAGKKPSIVTYGSSTLYHLTDDLRTFADEKNVNFYPYAISGDVLAGTGIGSNTNKLTIKFPEGEIIKDTYVPIELTASFGKTGGGVIEVELSDGTIGLLNHYVPSFKSTSQTKSVAPSTIFSAKSLWEKPSDGIYIINSGKNDITNDASNNDYIKDKTAEIISNLPLGSSFIVMGHFNDTVGDALEAANVEIINDFLRTEYGTHYIDINDILFDDATWAKLGLTKTAADVAAINDRRLPPSLSRDNGHLSVAMSTLLAEILEEKILQISDVVYYADLANTELGALRESVVNTDSKLNALHQSISNTIVPLKSLTGAQDAVSNNGAQVGDVYYRTATNSFYQLYAVANGTGQASPLPFSEDTLFSYKDKLYDLKTGVLKVASTFKHVKILPLAGISNLDEAVANGAKVKDFYYNRDLANLYQIEDLTSTPRKTSLYPTDEDTLYLHGNDYYVFNGTELGRLSTEKNTLKFENLRSIVDLDDAISNGATAGDIYYNSSAELFKLFKITDVENEKTQEYDFKENTAYVCDGVFYSLVDNKLEPLLGGKGLKTFELSSVIELRDAIMNGAQVGDVYYHNKLKGLYEITHINGTTGIAQPIPFKDDNVLYSCDGALYYYNGDSLVSFDTQALITPLGNRQLAVATPEDSISAYINGLKFADELDNHLVELTRPIDKFGHTASFIFHNDICYATLMVNTRGTGETPTQMSIVLCSFPVSNPSDVTYYEVCDIGDTVLGQVVAKNYDPVLFVKDGVIQILWNSVLGSDVEYTLLHQTFNPATTTFSDIATAKLKVKGTTVDLTSDGINVAFAAEGIRIPEFKEHIVLMGNATSRVEGERTYYYTAIGGRYGPNMIVKTVDFITWVYVAQPSFKNTGQYEPATYVIGDIVYYYCRQSASPYGFLTAYNLIKGTWADPVFISETQSRSQFFMYNSQLYLIYAPKDRHHLGIVRIDTKHIVRSRVVQVARVAGLYAYPAVDVNNGILYVLFSDNKEKLYVSNFTIESISADDIKTTFKQLFAI